MKDLSFKKTVSKVGFAYFAALLLTSTIQFLCQFIFKDIKVSVWIFSMLPLYLCGFPAAYFIMKQIPDCEQTAEKEKMSVTKFIKFLLIGYTFMYIGNLISLIISSLVTALTGKVLLNPVAAAVENANIFATFFYTVIVAPLGEEFFFRFLPYKKLSKYGDKTYILISALLFSVFHMNIFQIIYAFLMGTVLAYMYARTRNMKYNILMHMIINFIGAIVATFVQNNQILASVFGMIVIVAVAAGLILLIRSRNKAIYTVASEAYSEKPIKDTFLNIGMILFMLLFIISNIFSVILA